MTTSTRQRFTPRPRTTVALKGTTRTTSLHLDHASDLALTYCQSWLRRAGSLKVPASGIVRHALRLYVERLGHAADAAAEARAIERACRASSTDAGDQQAAWERLQGINEDAPLPPYMEVLYGPHWAGQADALTTRAEVLAADILAARPGRSRRTRESTHP